MCKIDISKVSADKIEERIKSYKYIYGTDLASNATYCEIILDNGFIILGKSACANSETYNKELGERFAREDAIHQAWNYLGYELRTKVAALEELKTKEGEFDPSGRNNVYVSKPKAVIAKRIDGRVTSRYHCQVINPNTGGITTGVIDRPLFNFIFDEVENG